MDEHRYVQMLRPWRAAFDVTTEQPAHFFATMMGQTLRYGMPARRKTGFVLGPVARHNLFPGGLTARALRILPRRRRPDLDALIALAYSQWRHLSHQSSRLAESPPRLTALALQRSAALTVFLFGDSPDPLMVLKIPSQGDDRVDIEAMALDEARSARVSPAALGRLGEARVQEGLPGAPLAVEPLRPATAKDLSWREAHVHLGHGFTRLAEHTAKKEIAGELRDPAMERGVEEARLPSSVHLLVSAAGRDLRKLDVAVLRHVDTSAQNCLFMRDQRLAGLVDWELARSCGAPGFDVWNAALAYMEHSVGLVKWSEEIALETFKASWNDSSFWKGGRSAARDAASAASVPHRLMDSLEVTFFARRLAWRLLAPDRFQTGPRLAAGMLEHVCVH